MTTPAKIEPWVKKLAQHVMMVLAHNTPHGPTEYEQALKVISSIIADDIAAHAPKASLSAIFECIGGEDNIGVILPEQLKRLTLNVIMPLLLEPGRLGELALILNRLVLTAEAHAPKQPEWEAKAKALREALITCVQELHNPQGYEHRRAVIDNAEAILNSGEQP